MTPRSALTRLAVRLLYPTMLAVSLWILWRGHHQPGGGFIGGMIAVAATSLLAVAEGSSVARRRLPFGPVRLAALGCLTSLASGLPALALGRPYLEHFWLEIPVGVTRLPLSTVLLFDLGVYVVVWGALGGLCAHALGLDEADEVAVETDPIPTKTEQGSGER